MPNVNRTVTYDANGNIASITQGTDTATYTYDLANELTEERHGADGEVIRYAYDTYGNLLSRTSYASPTDAAAETPQETLTYTYGNSSWKDQLTSCAVTTATGTATTSLTYDAMGNPTAIGTKSLTWEGKRLTAINTAGGQDPDITYAYDQNGLRLRKTVNGTNTNYHYNGSVLISQTTGPDTLLFSYDANGKAVSVRHVHTNADETVTTNDYYYLRNAQSDIVKLIDGTRETVVEYSYDGWGKLLNCTGTLATTLGALNPLRYRGYVYDGETGWYYLQSRYYDPEVGRFISADVYLSTGQGVLGCNAYCYCGNNCVALFDHTGHKATMPEDGVKSYSVYYGGDAVEKYSRGLRGKSYSEMDCSLFVLTVFSLLGIKLGHRNSNNQFLGLKHNSDWTVYSLENGEVNNIPKGAIVFFAYDYPELDSDDFSASTKIRHVGICMGNQMMFDSTDKNNIGVSERKLSEELTYRNKRIIPVAYAVLNTLNQRVYIDIEYEA